MIRSSQGITTDVMNRRSESKARLLFRSFEGDPFGELADNIAYVLEAPETF